MPPPQHPPAHPQLFVLGGSNNGVHPHPLSRQPTPPWHQSHFSFHPPPCQASPSSPSWSLEQYDGQMQGHFSSSHGGTIWKERPPTSPIRSAPQLGSAAGQDQPLSSSSPPILSTRYCSPQLPPAFHLSVLPCGEYCPFPPPRCCTGFIFVAKVVSVPADHRRGPFLLVLFLSLFFFFCTYCKVGL